MDFRIVKERPSSCLSAPSTGGVAHPRGFTLIELMVVVVIVAILASMALPRFRTYIITGDLEEAKPYLMAIATKERARFNEKGRYFHSTLENELESELGVGLREAGNFCFMVICHDLDGAQTCEGRDSADDSEIQKYIVDKEDDDDPIEFEVWAVLRARTADPVPDIVAAYGPSTCTVADEKNTPSGWVSTESADVGGLGRVVVLRYPPPVNGLDDRVANFTNAASDVRHDWVSGMSIRDVTAE